MTTPAPPPLPPPWPPPSGWNATPEPPPAWPPPPTSAEARLGPTARVAIALIAAGTLTASLVAGGLFIDQALTHSAGAPRALTHSTGATPSPSIAGPPDLSSVLMAQPQTPGVSVDPAQAQGIVEAIWPVRENALFTRDINMIQELEIGPAAEWDTVRCTFGCPPPSPRPMTEVRVFVPRQSTYPATFLAEVLTTTDDHLTPYVETMIFSRGAATHPWVIALDTGYSGFADMAEAPMSDADEFDAPTPTFAGVQPAALPAQLAAYWQHWKDSGTPPPATHFLHGTWTDLQGQNLHAFRIQLLASGEVEHATYSAEPDTFGNSTFAMDETVNGRAYPGWALSCGTVRYKAVITPTVSSAALIQPEDQSEWGTLLRPGSYAKITQVGLHQSCFLIQPGFPNIGVVGANGDVIQITGIPDSTAPA